MEVFSRFGLLIKVFLLFFGSIVSYKSTSSRSEDPVSGRLRFKTDGDRPRDLEGLDRPLGTFCRAIVFCEEFFELFLVSSFDLLDSSL